MDNRRQSSPEKENYKPKRNSMSYVPVHRRTENGWPSEGATDEAGSRRNSVSKYRSSDIMVEASLSSKRSSLQSRRPNSNRFSRNSFMTDDDLDYVCIET